MHPCHTMLGCMVLRIRQGTHSWEAFSQKGQEVEALFRLVCFAQAKVVYFCRSAIYPFGGRFGCFPCLSSALCPNSCLNFSTTKKPIIDEYKLYQPLTKTVALSQ